MKHEKRGLMLLVSFLSVGLFFLAGEGKPNKKEPEERTVKSLIRKELLLKEKGELGPSRRNIFYPYNSGMDKTDRNAAWFRNNPQEGAPAFEEKDPSLTLDIRYIGYIISKEKIIALIMFRGSVLAVEKGEMIDMNIQAGEITTEELEIIGANSEKRKYPLEGERL